MGDNLKVALIGGTGMDSFTETSGMVSVEWKPIIDAPLGTPFGMASAIPEVALFGGGEVIFLPRHGRGHRIAPHLINYRANVWLLHALDVDLVIASYAVGAIATDFKVADLVIPNQIIDYTWGREHTFTDLNEIQHVDFTEPFDAKIRRRLLDIGPKCSLDGRLHGKGVYGCMQGPRFESAAEIDRLERDGCDVVGMTGMPEAALACELEIPFGGICFIVNQAAGRGVITSDGIRQASSRGIADLRKLIFGFVDGANEAK